MKIIRIVGWAKVVAGHQEHYGRVLEVDQFGTVMMLVEIPDPETGRIANELTFGGRAIYSITKMSEEDVKAKLRKPAPPLQFVPVLNEDDCQPHDTERPSAAEAIDTDPDTEV